MLSTYEMLNKCFVSKRNESIQRPGGVHGQVCSERVRKWLGRSGGVLLEALSLQGILWNLTPRNKVRALASSGHTTGTCDPEATGTRGREILAFCGELGEASVLWPPYAWAQAPPHSHLPNSDARL